jgi:hypothetical protein
MVNIVAIVVINPNSTLTFNSFDSWWQTVINTSSHQKRIARLNIKARRDRLAIKLSNKYDIPIQRMKNVGFLFSSTKQVKEAMLDYENRSLLCDPDTSIILHLRFENNIIGTITIAHNLDRFKVFPSSTAVTSQDHLENVNEREN